MKSAYNIAVDIKSGSDSGAIYDESSLRKFWKHLWRSNVPHKVRHFTWRTCKNILPTKDILEKRKSCQKVAVKSVRQMWSHRVTCFGLVLELKRPGLCLILYWRDTIYISTLSWIFFGMQLWWLSGIKK